MRTGFASSGPPSRWQLTSAAKRLASGANEACNAVRIPHYGSHDQSNYEVSQILQSHLIHRRHNLESLKTGLAGVSKHC